MHWGFVRALCTLRGPSWLQQPIWTGVRSCAASMTFVKAGTSCIIGARPVRFSISRRILTGFLSCQEFCHRSESQLALLRTVDAAKKARTGSNFHGLVLTLGKPRLSRRVLTRGRAQVKFPMSCFLRMRCWRTMSAWPQLRTFGECGAFGSRAIALEGAGLRACCQS